MPRLDVTPSSLLLRTDAGSGATTTITVFKAPSAATVRASVTTSSGRLTLRQIIVSRTYTRALTPAEIDELPDTRPSIRENAIRQGVQEAEEVGRIDGTGSIAVQTGQKVDFQLDVAPSSPTSPDLELAKLVIDGTGWEEADVEIQIINGDGTIASTALPQHVDVVLAPGQASTYDVNIAAAPSSTSLIARINSDTPIISLQQTTVFHLVKKQYTEQEIDEMPEPQRAGARANGYTVQEASAKAAAGQPLAVLKGQLVTITLGFAAPTVNIPDEALAQLLIDAPSWAPADIPVRALIGQISATLSPDTITAPLGGGATLAVALTSLAGADTEVRFSQGDGWSQWNVEPASVHLAKGASLSIPVRILPTLGGPLGTFAASLALRAFDDVFGLELPFTVDVTPARVTVTPSSVRAVVPQDGSAAFNLECTTGDHRTLTLSKGPGAPTGVSMLPVTTQLAPGPSVIVPVQIAATHQALAGDTTLPIQWSAGDGLNQGAVLAPISIQPVVESRTFHRDITTGSALGGSIDLTVRSDGTYTFKVHMDGSGLDPYAFRISVTVWAPDNSDTRFGAFCSGAVGGAVGSTPRQFDFEETKSSVLLQVFWTDVRDGRFESSIDYDDTGVLAAAADLAAIAVKLLVANVVAGPVGATIVLGSELGQYTSVPFLLPSALAGAIVAGTTVFILGPGIALGAIIAGAAVGAQIKTRPLRDTEVKFAKLIFDETLPIDRIVVTNLSRGDRAFCAPSLDGSIIIGLGGVSDGGVDRFDDPLKMVAWRSTLIHELTHSWQIAHFTVPEKLIWQAAVNEGRSQEDVYDIGFYDGRKWSDYEVEQQAVVVQNYYESIQPTTGTSLDLVDSPAHPAYRYIQGNIRLGVA